jgi:hypothetical protein
MVLLLGMVHYVSRAEITIKGFYGITKCKIFELFKYTDMNIKIVQALHYIASVVRLIVLMATLTILIVLLKAAVCRGASVLHQTAGHTHSDVIACY